MHELFAQAPLETKPPAKEPAVQSNPSMPLKHVE